MGRIVLSDNLLILKNLIVQVDVRIRNQDLDLIFLQRILHSLQWVLQIDDNPGHPAYIHGGGTSLFQSWLMDIDREV